MSDERLPTIIDFSEDIATAEAPAPLPKRDYVATIKDVERKTSNANGKEYAAVAFFISPDQYPADYDAENAPEGKTIVYRRVPLEDDRPSRARLRKFGEAIGASLAKRIDISEWIGLSATVTVDHETYEGIEREVITKVSMS